MKERNTYREGGRESVCEREKGGEQWRKKIKKKGGSEKIVTKPAAKTNHL